MAKEFVLKKEINKVKEIKYVEKKDAKVRVQRRASSVLRA